jgi:hypothetical protein
VLLHLRDWAGEIRPADRGPWRARAAGHEARAYPNPAGEVQQAEEALRAFLRDEFPALQPAVQHLLVLSDPTALLAGAPPAEGPAVVPQEELAAALLNLAWPAGAPRLGAETRQALARALEERQLTARQRAAAPFVFRSGGLFGSGKKVWTVRAAVRHMDRHPATASTTCRTAPWPAGWRSRAPGTWPAWPAGRCTRPAGSRGPTWRPF